MTSLGTFQLGQKPTLTLTYTDVDGALADPSSPVLQVKYPDGTETDYTTGFTKVSLGVWTWAFPDVLSLDGRYFLRSTDDGSVGFSEEAEFFVASSHFTALP